MTDESIRGKVVIITGASSGIGKATAIHLAQLGARLSLGARRMDSLEDIRQEIENSGGEVLITRTDVTQRTEVRRLIDKTIESYGRIDVLVNNAGIMPLSRIDKLQFDEWDQMIDTNIKGVLYAIGAVVPQMKAQKSGHVINIASLAGHRVPVNSGSAVYSATKFAVRAISEGFRQEVKPYRIRTTIISPGATETELPDKVTDPDIKKNMQGLLDLAISPDSVARAIAYAISQPEAYDINEILIRPNGQVN